MNQTQENSVSEDIAVYFSGEKLYGDDLKPHEVEAWVAEEVAGYESTWAKGPEAYYYSYEEMDKRHGFRHLGDRVFEEVLGFGCAYGDEFKPIADQIKKIILFEPSDAFANIREIFGIPTEYVKPNFNGTMPFDANRFDLITNISVMHHIPNVSHVMSECYRCLKQGGIMLLRMVIVSQGDWRAARIGLTKRSRGVPLNILHEIIRDTGFKVNRSAPCFFPIIPKLVKVVDFGMYDNYTVTWLDAVLSKAFAWNIKYHVTKLHEKFAPQCVYMVLEK